MRTGGTPVCMQTCFEFRFNMRAHTGFVDMDGEIAYNYLGRSAHAKNAKPFMSR